MTSAIEAKTIHTCHSLLRRALDPAAMDGEAENAVGKFLAIARQNGLSFDNILTVTQEPKEREPKEPPACSVVMTFGKYAGMTLGDIACEDLGYLEWVAEEIDSKPALKRAARIVTDYYGGMQ